MDYIMEESTVLFKTVNLAEATASPNPQKLLEFVLPGEIKGKKNNQQIIMVAGKRKIVPSKEYVEWHKRAIAAIPKDICIRINTPVILVCRFWFDSSRRRDLVNMMQSVCDILTDAQIWADDCWTICRDIRMDAGIDRDTPRTEIALYTCPYPVPEAIRVPADYEAPALDLDNVPDFFHFPPTTNYNNNLDATPESSYVDYDEIEEQIERIVALENTLDDDAWEGKEGKGVDE